MTSDAGKYRKLKKQIDYLMGQQRALDIKRSELNKEYWATQVKINSLDREAKIFSHAYEIGEFVVVEVSDGQYNVQKIMKLLGVKMYKTFEYLGRHVGTEGKIHESQIICCVQNLRQYFEVTKR